MMSHKQTLYVLLLQNGQDTSQNVILISKEREDSQITPSKIKNV